MNSNLTTYLSAAKRSVLLACAPLSVPRLLTSIERCCGPPKHVFYWPKKERMGVLLVEMESEEQVNHKLSRIPGFPHIASMLPSSDRPFAHKLQLSTFRLCSDLSRWPVLHRSSHPVVDPLSFLPRDVVPLNPVVSPRRLTAKLRASDTFYDQVSVLFNATRLTYPDLLARFVVCDSIQDLLASVRLNTEISVFGSAVDGLGSISSDLDLVIRLGSEIAPEVADFPPCTSMTPRSFGMGSTVSIYSALLAPESKLKPVFLSVLRRLLTRLDPLGFHDAKVFPGRIPILHIDKFKLLGVGLDISRVFTDSSSRRKLHFHDGLQMGLLLRALGIFVPEFPKCITVLKFLSRQSGLTREGPSPGLTNFKLTVLFVHFLQSHGYAPSFDRLAMLVDSNALEVSAEELRPFPSIHILLRQFFDYIPTLNPSDFILSLRAGRALPRNTSAPTVEPGVRFHTMEFIQSETTTEHEAVSVTDSSFVVCPNPIHPCQNILHGVDEEDWAHLTATCAHWSELLTNNIKRPPDASGDYYKGCIFHRNIKGFIVQTGDPTGTGKNGQSIWKKKFKDEFHESLRHNTRGIVSMANNGPDSNGSQFFITYSKQTMLDMKYSIFAKVIDGWNVLDELERAPVEEKTYRPLTDIHIQNVTIHANPFAE
ncbi:hypothetical protein P879_03776 [Paragonimus westermani]|uniref:PPIase cyclophilin-type domain-containing protein n=1 Tax=Paragonimus westermani TaxID=34504 RepID=A0A8T0DPQ4_9TREM|nr:hypothetical protein P879_03776 [Paragonimus westermani]